MYVTDNNNIVSITPHFPDLMSGNYKSVILKLFSTMREKEKELSDAKMKIHELEKEVKELQTKWKLQSAIFDIEFDKKEIQEIKEECLLGIINPSDYRNHE